MIVLKLGGSVVTEKDRPKTVDHDSLDRISGVIGSQRHDVLSEGLIIVHGGGSFGHQEASKRNVSESSSTESVEDVLAIHSTMATLNTVIVDSLASEDVSAVPIHPLSCTYRDADGSLQIATGSIEAAIEQGFVPVTHGDIVIDRRGGATILSGDELVVELARSLDIERIGMCSTVPGVLDEDGAVIERITAFEAVDDLVGSSSDTDVTGGMAGKVRRLLDLEKSATIFGLDDLDGFIADRSVGTTIGESG